jgi:transcriptional regulator with XRE-family HTH domain
LAATLSYLSLGKCSSVSFHAVLRNIRLRKNMSSRKLAELCGFSPAYFSKIETGSTIPSSKFLAKIFDVLECSPEEILFIMGTLLRDDDES